MPIPVPSPADPPELTFTNVPLTVIPLASSLIKLPLALIVSSVRRCFVQTSNTWQHSSQNAPKR